MSSRLRAFGESVFTPVTRLAVHHKAVNLGQGFPDFDGPVEIRDAAIRAMKAGHNQYAHPHGVPELRDAIARWTMTRPNDVGLNASERDDDASESAAPVDPDTDVTVTCGCTEALPATMLGLLEPGDEVVVFEPFYDAYPAAIAMAGATLRPVRLHAPDFRFSAAELDAAMTPKTRMILVNTPHNPTGTVFNADELNHIARLCCRHDLICVTDEVYEQLVFDVPHQRMRDHADMRDRTVTLSSLGKTFSLTGWKIGWAVAPPALTEGIRAAHQYLTYAVATPLQHGAAAALDLGRTYFDEYRRDYRAKRDRLVEGLASVGFDVQPPQGTYFVMAGHQPFGFDDDWEFCRHLIENVGVAAIPTSAFYAGAGAAGGKSESHPFLRFAFCKDLSTIDAAIDRMRGHSSLRSPRG